MTGLVDYFEEKDKVDAAERFKPLRRSSQGGYSEGAGRGGSGGAFGGVGQEDFFAAMREAEEEEGEGEEEAVEPPAPAPAPARGGRR